MVKTSENDKNVKKRQQMSKIDKLAQQVQKL